MTQCLEKSKLFGMNAHQVIEAMGGRAEVMRITQLSKGRLSQWSKDNHIPRPWMLLFHQINPAGVPHPDARRSESKGVGHV